MKRLLLRIEETRDEMAADIIREIDRMLDWASRGINERGKRAVERHWLFRSAGNHTQKKRPKGERKYSYVAPKYNDVKGKVYYQWTRFLFRSRTGRGRVRTISPIPQTKENGYDLRKLKRGATKWEGEAIMETERYLTKIREANRQVVEARRALEKLSNTIAGLERMDREHYQVIRSEILELGYSSEEFEKIQESHLSIMKRAKKEGTDMRPFTQSPYYLSERMKKNFDAPPPENEEDGLPEITNPDEEEWVPELLPEEQPEDEPQKEESLDEAPDPNAMDRLYRPWLYE